MKKCAVTGLICLFVMVAGYASAESMQQIQSMFGAIQNSNLSRVKELVAQGIDVNMQDSEGRTPTMCAVAMNQNAILTFLVDSGADLEVRDKMNFTALHYAADVNNSRAVDILVTNGLDVDVRGFDSPRDGPSFSTPLHIAAQGKAFEAAKALISNGADVNALTNVKNGKYRRSVLFWAVKSRDKSMTNLLKEHGAVKFPDGATK
jgi:ankyrin repeat protein